MMVGGPLLGAVVIAVMGRRISRKGAGVVSMLSTGLGAGVSLLAGYEVLMNGATTYVELGAWVELGVVEIRSGMQVDGVSAPMCLVVLNVSMLVQMYAIGYMEGDRNGVRIHMYMSMIVTAMMVLVTADSYMGMIVG